jgi:hypothetical protein
MATARAQVKDYPNQPIQVTVSFVGGSASNVVTRILLHDMSKSVRPAPYVASAWTEC